MLATYAASRHRQIVPCCMISSVSHDNVSRLVTDRSMCFATALDKAFENIDCMSAILRCQTTHRFYESTQRLIQPRRVLCETTIDLTEVKPIESIVSAPDVQQARQKQLQNNKKVAPFLAVFAVILVAVGIYQSKTIARLEASGLRANGEVVRLKDEY